MAHTNEFIELRAQEVVGLRGLCLSLLISNEWLLHLKFVFMTKS